MRIGLVTPAAPGTRNGNRVTANRWARLLRQLGHRVEVITRYYGENFDLLVAIHAWRSGPAVLDFKTQWPDRPLVLLLAGTDIYEYQAKEPETTHHSMALADRLVGLHDRVHLDIPDEFLSKLSIIYQSCPAFPRPRMPVKRSFRVCVIANLRSVKDPLRAALAARYLTADSRLQIVHVGKAESEDWAQRAQSELHANPRYTWRGPATGGEVRRLMSSSHAMVISSIDEGGANVVSEAIVRGLPVFASDMSGNRGLLGESYQGYFGVGDDRALRELYRRAEAEPQFLEALGASLLPKASRFCESTERESWRQLLEGLC